MRCTVQMLRRILEKKDYLIGIIPISQDWFRAGWKPHRIGITYVASNYNYIICRLSKFMFCWHRRKPGKNTSLKRTAATAVIISVFAVVCLFISCGSGSADAAEETSGKCGDNVYWNFNTDTGELVVSGTGKMTDYAYDAPWTGLDVRSLTIEEGIEFVGAYAFSDCDNLVSVSIPDSVTLIRYSAFAGCPSLTAVHIGSGVTTIEHDAFSGCRSLISLSIPDSVTKIGSASFHGCSSLVSINIPNITVIESATFRDCKSLKSISIPDSVEKIEDYVFTGCKSLTSVYIGSGVTSLKEKQFSTCMSLTSISVSDSNKNYSSDNGVLFSKDMTEFMQYPIGKADAEYIIPEGVIVIDESAFNYCNSLDRIVIPDSVTKIGDGAFEGCSSISSVMLSNSLSSVGRYVFKDCSSIASIVIPNTVTKIGKNAFGGCSSLSSVTIGSSVTSIENYAFERCTSLKSIVIPGNVNFIGSYAFCECTSLESIYVDESNGEYRSDNGVLFTYDKTKLIQYPIGNTNKSYVVPDCVKSIERYAFYKSVYLASVIIPDGVNTVGTHAFNGCTSIVSITIPGSVTSIKPYAFNNCTSLESISVDGSNVKYRSDNGVLFTNDGTELIQYPIGKTDASYAIREGVLKIHDGAFMGCTDLVSITVPGSVKDIGGDVFFGCKSLKSISVEESNKMYRSEDGVLFDADMTELIQYPSGKTDSEYTIPDTVDSVGKAFVGAVALKAISVGEGNKEYRSEGGGLISAHDNILVVCPAGIEEYTVPRGVLYIDEYAFSGDNLRTVTFAYDDVDVRRHSFYNCSSLNKIVIMEGADVEFKEQSICSDTGGNIHIVAPEGFVIQNNAVSEGIELVFDGKSDSESGFPAKYAAAAAVILIVSAVAVFFARRD